MEIEESKAAQAIDNSAVKASKDKESVKINPDLFKLKELLGLVVYKKGQNKPTDQSLANKSADSIIQTSKYWIEGSSARIEAVDLIQDEASFDTNASF